MSVGEQANEIYSKSTSSFAQLELHSSQCPVKCSLVLYTDYENLMINLGD